MAKVYKYVISPIEANVMRSDIHCGKPFWRRFDDGNYILFVPTELSKIWPVDIDDLSRDIVLYDMYKKKLMEKKK